MSLSALDLGLTDPAPMPVLDVSRCYTRPINHRTAALTVERFHYAHRVPSIVAAVGMYVDDVLAGVVTYGIPPNRNVLACCGEERIPEALELNRLFVHDWAGRNSESWLIGQSFRWLADRWPEVSILVSYADTAAGHLGRIYQATNWTYTGCYGEGGKEGIRLTDGTVIHAKDLHNRYGDATISVVKQALGSKFAEVVDRSPKHRYVYFLGDRRQRRAPAGCPEVAGSPLSEGEPDVTPWPRPIAPPPRRRRSPAVAPSLVRQLQAPPEPEPLPEVLFIEEAAKLLRADPATIRRWARAGKLPGVRWGRRWRFLRVEVERRLVGPVGAGETP